MVPKHRRSGLQPSLASAGAPADATEFRPGAARGGEALEARSWQDWNDWQDWGPPPALHPDHPSAPVPRVQLPADHPSGPMPAPRAPATPGPAGARSRLSPASPGVLRPLPVSRKTNGPGSLPTYLAVAAPGQVHREVSQFLRQPGRIVREPAGYRRQTGPGWQESAGDRHQMGLLGPGRGPATGRFQNGHTPHSESLSIAGQVLAQAEGQAAQIAQQARADAAAIRDAAEREAAAVRDAAERDVTELRARLDSMVSELGRVVAYVTESLASSAFPATAPSLPDTGPGRPGPTSALSATRPTQRPDPKPGSRPAGPAKPRTTAPRKPQKRPRQLQAMRIATFATATMLLVAVISGATEIGLHGFRFFVFREGGVGQTPGNETDQQFLSRQAAVSHHVVAPKGRHHRKTDQPQP